MSSNSTGKITDTNAADYLNELRLAIAEDQAGKIAGNNITPNYIIPENETVNVSDDAQIDNNKQTPSDTVNVSDAATPTSHGLVFYIENDAGTGTLEPGKIDFSVIS